MRSISSMRILLGSLMVLVVAACSSSANPTAPAQSASPTAGQQTVSLNALDTFKYDPTTITAKVGQPVHVILVNKGVLVHTWVVDQFSVKLENVQGGATGDVTFTPTQAGTYVFYCDTPGHQAAGMVGTLVVNP